MILFKEAEKTSDFIRKAKSKGKKVSFVPTMGALHPGHLALLTEAAKTSDLTVCSIFVNPTQFNNPDDYTKYPNTIERDIEHLIKVGCGVLFLPSVDEIYPQSYIAPKFDLGNLESILEGKFRPGHFQGVCQVVDRLLQIITPDTLFLGQKDYQQCKVINQLLLQTNRKDISLFILPTVREADGLAMSSRNLRLSAEQRAKAPALYAALLQAKLEIETKRVEEIKEASVKKLSQLGFSVDYFEIVEADTLLQPQTNTGKLMALVAACLDDIRLIDNLPLR